MTEANAAFFLSPAEPSDLQELTNIAGAAAIRDTHTKLKAFAKGYSQNDEGVVQYHSKGIQPMFEQAFGSDRRHVVVAKDGEGKILGSIVWATSDSAFATTLPNDERIKPFEVNQPSLGSRTAENLENLTNEAMWHYIKEITTRKGPFHYYIVSMNLSPECQRKGIGSAMIKSIIDEARKDTTFCWVNSGLGSQKFYEKLGFKEVGRLEIDLDEWAPNLLRNTGCEKRDWGNYTWTWLVNYAS